MSNLSQLRILHYPDPHLRGECQPVSQFTPELAELAQRMLELMHEAEGVGLAAAQVGSPHRIFVMNATGKAVDDCVIVNPVLADLEGSAEDEEGCLSIPGVRVKVRRAERVRIVAQDLGGKPLELRVEGLAARIAQHETDHLNGVLIIDRMGPTDKIATRKTLRSLIDSFGPGGRP